MMAEPSVLASLWSEVTTATWLANVLGSMIGVGVGVLVALIALRKQLRQDRKLFAMQARLDREQFQDTLLADREKERRERRQATAYELAQLIGPAAERLQTMQGLDVSNPDWPDYAATFAGLSRMQNRLFAMGMLDLYQESVTVLNVGQAAWNSGHRAVQACIAESPGTYAKDDIRIRQAMLMAELMTGRKALASLETALLGWDGDGELLFEDPTTVEELNEIAGLVRKAMIRS